MGSKKVIAIVGATGAVGREFVGCIESRGIPLASLKLLASARSAGQKQSFRGEELTIEELTADSFNGVDIALFSAGATSSRAYADKFAAAGAVVIDNSSAFRNHDDVPLVVSEVNPEAARDRPRGIIANPNCSTAQLVVALKPLHDRAVIKRVVVATYQSVSGAGKDAMDELFNQSRAIFSAGEVKVEKFSKRIAFNVIPHIGVFLDDGYTKEEWKMVVETKKILDPKIKLTATCVRVPVFISHSEAVNVEFEPIRRAVKINFNNLLYIYICLRLFFTENNVNF